MRPAVRACLCLSIQVGTRIKFLVEERRVGGGGRNAPRTENGWLTRSSCIKPFVTGRLILGRELNIPAEHPQLKQNLVSRSFLSPRSTFGPLDGCPFSPRARCAASSGRGKREPAGGRTEHSRVTFARTFRLMDDCESILLPLLNNTRTLRWMLPVCCFCCRCETAARALSACHPVGGEPVSACHCLAP